MERGTKLVVVVRADLAMGKGKIAAQVAHAAVTAALLEQETAAFAAWWRAGQPKVVLRIGSEAALTEIGERAKAAGLPVHAIRDAGRTQVSAGTMTCCAIGPGDTEQIDRVTGALALL
ncbi:peptidyl-tRNA hydrolase Pth2 [Winogradskya consettensis]|uniref:peptidyl-tRNA hydrolase Pth2 n=1 Tax=Winogradskya consettensis TaxID=113560 RepID=UPI001FD616E0|nr:peptidyl-tRNA hydrolase Pth2 [Actinoplanes consettensis]